MPQGTQGWAESLGRQARLPWRFTFGKRSGKPRPSQVLTRQLLRTWTKLHEVRLRHHTEAKRSAIGRTARRSTARRSSAQHGTARPAPVARVVPPALRDGGKGREEPAQLREQAGLGYAARGPARAACAAAAADDQVGAVPLDPATIHGDSR
jgi:hypothetical protein